MYLFILNLKLIHITYLLTDRNIFIENRMNHCNESWNIRLKIRLKKFFSNVIEILFKSAFKTSFHYLCFKNVTIYMVLLHMSLV